MLANIALVGLIYTSAAHLVAYYSLQNLSSITVSQILPIWRRKNDSFFFIVLNASYYVHLSVRSDRWAIFFLYQFIFFSDFYLYRVSIFPVCSVVRLVAGASFFIALKNGVPLFLLNSKYLKWISDLYVEVSLFAEWIINASNAILKRHFLI